MAFEISDSRKIGTILLFLGMLFLFLGVMFLFDRKLLAMGNILFVSGFAFLSGARRTLYFFGIWGDRVVDRWKSRWRGLVTFIGGVALVLSGWTMIGMGIEMFGFLNLFGSFFPLAIGFFRTLPVVGTVLSLPVVAPIVDKIAGITKGQSSLV